jgi:hypothetical protein
MTIKRGRKKGSRNRFSGEPHNLAFWKLTLSRPEEINAFIDRGNKNQKQTIKEILLYLKVADIDFFNKVNGKKILKELK